MSYAQAAPIYQKQGWPVIPVKGKTPVPTDCTGRHGTVTDAKIAAWISDPEWARANTAIRHETTIAIDVDDDDHAPGKHGADALAAWEGLWGALPATYSSTARGAGSKTRQYLFRVPPGVHFPAQLGPDIEIIQHDHRYTVVADSIHPDTGAAYQWFDPEDQPCSIPSIDDIEELPDEWLAGLQAMADKTGTADDLAAPFDGGAVTWLAGVKPGEPDKDMMLAIMRWSGRGHETLIKWQAHIVGRAGAGMPGADKALKFLEQRWNAAEHTSAEPGAFAAGLAGAVAKYGGTRHTNTATPDAFWNARPELALIYRNSRRVMASPWALLGTALARAIHVIPYDVRYRSALGFTSINLSAIRVGGSGGGKSSSERHTDTMLRFLDGLGMPTTIETVEAGSGEAMAEQYAHIAQKTDDEAGIRAGELVWHRDDHAIYFTFDEVGRLVKVGGRDGSTLFEYIKTGWSGEVLGRRLVRGGVQLPRDSYRMTVMMNGQAERCEALLSADEIAGGFPGRLLWFDAVDPTLVDAPHDRTPLETLTVKSRAWYSREIHALPVMNDAHEADRRAFHAGDRNPMDGHELLTRAKVAIALMSLAGREALIESDWELSEAVMAHSRTTRAAVQAQIAAASAERVTAQGQRDGTRSAIADDIRARRAIDRVVLLLMKYDTAGVPENQWRNRLRSTDRDLYDDALRLYREGADDE